MIDPPAFGSIDSARERDRLDPAPAREQFALLPLPSGEFDTYAYFAGNSLGLQPLAARTVVNDVLDSWSQRGVSGHFRGDEPWTEQAARISGPMARIVGAREHEVVTMNTLTINLHLVLSALVPLHPQSTRSRIAIEGGAFPSDDYAVASFLRSRGLDPKTHLVRLLPESSGLFSTDGLIAQIRALGSDLAAIELGAINFRSGQSLDVARITAAAHDIGAVAIWDLAHAAGNIPLQLHDWNVDAAVWCNYKYLNGGPGALGGMYVHERWVNRTDIGRLAGWWGNNPDTRFDMREEIDHGPGALGWQVSTPPSLAMVPIRAAVDMIDALGFPQLAARSQRLTAYLESLFDVVSKTHRMTQLTPRNPAERGAQLSMIIDNAPEITAALESHGVIADERPPNIIRFAPVPLYNSYEDCWRAAHALTQVLPTRT